MASSLKRSFKDRAKEKLGFGTKTKAQSVDTAGIGIMNPLSWDNLSSDIKEKLLGESISAKPDSLPESDIVFKSEFKRSDSQDSNDGHGNNLENNKKPKQIIIKPKGTMDYKIKNRDTLASIAAQFDTTPSELCNLNRLSTRLIFPGQNLFVPDKDYFSSASDDSVPNSPVASSPPKHKPPDIPCVMQAPSSPIKSPPKGPGLAERIAAPPVKREESPPHPLSEDEARRLDRECHERFIKLNVKHITDGQGVVSGVLLVTPNAIMFDPNVSDPLVIEHGADTYGMIAPMDTVISVAMYHDIAAMKLKGANKDQSEQGHVQKPEVYHSKTCPFAQQKLLARRFSENDKKNIKPDAILAKDSGITDRKKLDENSVSDGEKTNETSQTVQSERGSNLDQSEHSCQASAESAQRDLNSGLKSETEAPSRAITDHEGQLQTESGARLLGDSLDADTTEEGRLGKVRFRETTEDINACLQPKDACLQPKEDDELKVGSVESGIAEMEEEKPESSPPPLTPHMQIGNIMYFQYGSVDGGEAVQDEPKPEEEKIPIKPFPAEDAEPEKSPMTPREEPISDSPVKRSDPIPAPLKKPAGNIGKGSFSPLNFSPNFSSFVDFSSGLFSANKDDRAKVKDMSEVPVTELPQELTTSMEKLDETQVTLTDNDLELITLRRSSNSTWYTKPFQIISDTVSNTMTTGRPDENAAMPGGKGEKPMIELEVESAVKMEDKPELFQSIDELIPRPARQFEDPPLYLCLKVGIPINKRVSATCPIEAYSRKRKKPEYWFSIPREKVDNLYAFFIQWSPNLYGGEDEIDPHERGFVVIEDDDEVEEDLHVDFLKGRITRSVSKDWEIVNVEEARRRLSILEVEDSLPLPELVGNTVILSEDHVRALCKKLPARAEGYPWTLIYSSDQNGFSLKTLYRNMYDYDTPVLLVIKDTANSVFGAMTSCSLKYSDHFYGTGESFLYTFYPEFKIFNWTGENNFFIKGNKESLAIGAGKGSFGIWLDGDLYHGRTQKCDTYSNEPLSIQEDFIVKGFEAWGFV